MEDQAIQKPSELETLVEHGLIDDSKAMTSDSLKGTLCYLGVPGLLGSSMFFTLQTTKIAEITDDPTLGALLAFGGMALTGLTAITAFYLPKLACYFCTQPSLRTDWRKEHNIIAGSKEDKFYSWLDKRTIEKCKIYQ